MVVFAVYVSGDTAAKRGELGTWSNRREKTARYCEADKVFNGDAGLGAQQSLLWIEIEKVLERQCGDYVIVQTGIAIGTAAALGQDRGLVVGPQIAAIAGASNRGVDSGIEAPARSGRLFCQ